MWGFKNVKWIKIDVSSHNNVLYLVPVVISPWPLGVDWCLQSDVVTNPRLQAYARAFDYEKWESWASDADIGWGAWSVETGWTQSWITTTMGMRLLNTSLWELGASIEGIEDDFDSWIPAMFPPPPPPPPPPPCLPGPAGAGGAVSFNMSNTVEQLCSDGATPVTTMWTGHVCAAVNPAGERPGLLWETMKTVNPRPGVEPAACSWTRSADPADIPGYFGGCNTPATAVPGLPDSLC